MVRNSRIVFVYILIVVVSGFLIIIGWQNYQSAEVVVEWSTASELETVGYNLYRSTTESQKGEKVNPTLIPSGQDLILGNDYSYVDKNLRAGAYYYWLEEVDRQGNTSQSGPIIVNAKHSMEGLLLILLGVILFVSLGATILWRTRRRSKIVAAITNGESPEQEVGVV